ncbi:MAG TPA: MBL fold metallo-hydrolase [Pyrinomonadaceae bacterium]|jgi:glyoxylase-like metal-dependent hydrolase (beta-lactamase superfamily II)/8-oxo-dGTP pyrophosphatase MutT (NUDIX family)
MAQDEATKSATNPTTAAPPRGGDAVPKDAAAVVLVRAGADDVAPEGAASPAAAPQLFWARRGARLAFLGGFYAFPGGQRDAEDAEPRVENCADDETAAMITCAARELFEEVGVLVARGADALTKGQLESVLDDLTSGRMTFPALLAHYGLRLDARDFAYAGRWVTPPFSPRRFDTWFFLARCPRKQEPRVRTSEFDHGEWADARAALARWQRGEVLVAPPVLHAVRALAGGLTDDLIERFLSVPQAHRAPVRRIEFLPGFICFPLRTLTKPPATHTNCYLVGHGEFVILDPGSPDADEQAALAACVDELIGAGRTAREIVLTHHHPDHVAGVEALRAHLGGRVPVAAHRLTAEVLAGQVRVDRFIAEGDVIELAGEPALALRALHTPGHTRGHLSFHEARTGALLCGDNILGLGSVLIEPPEGDMRAYLDSLRRYRALLPDIKVLLGGHGPAVGSPAAKIDEYIAHRLEREANILRAVRAGAATPPEIVARVYTDVHPKLHALAERAVLAHLEKLEADGLVARAPGGGHVAAAAGVTAD